MRTDTILSISRGSVECTFKPIRVSPVLNGVFWHAFAWENLNRFGWRQWLIFTTPPRIVLAQFILCFTMIAHITMPTMAVFDGVYDVIISLVIFHANTVLFVSIFACTDRTVCCSTDVSHNSHGNNE